jgi:hypothetical protein
MVATNARYTSDETRKTEPEPSVSGLVADRLAGSFALLMKRAKGNWSRVFLG